MCNVSNYNFTHFIGSPYTGLVRVQNAFLANLKKQQTYCIGHVK